MKLPGGVEQVLSPCDQVRTWNRMLEWSRLLSHRSIVPAPDVPEAMMSGARSPLLWRLATTTPVAPAVVVSVLLVHVTGLPPLFWYHATPAAAVELLATISSLPSRSRSAKARLVTPVAAASIVNAVQAPGAVMVAVAQGVAVQGVLYPAIAVAVLFAWMLSGEASPSTAATPRAFEQLDPPPPGMSP